MTDQPTFSPEQFRQAQHTLGLSDAQLAPMLGISEQHVRRLKTRPDANQHRTVNDTLARLLDAYLAGYRPDDWPAPRDKK